MLFFLGLLLDWLGQTLLFSHWSTHSECSTYSEFVAVAAAVEGMPIIVDVEGVAMASPHRRRCRGDGEPFSSSLMSRGWPWPALITVAVEEMASPPHHR